MMSKVLLLTLSTLLPAGSLIANAATASDVPKVLAEPRFQQVALTTADLPRAIGFYRDRLGLPLLFVSNDMAFFEVGGVRLMIATDEAKEPVRPASILYFNADDFPAALERLNSSGARLVGAVETVQRKAESELRLQQFEDPDGNMLAIMGTVRLPAPH